jgi:4-amino-4-deoxy-L-arabinose transferase-like glycosyltransferase
MTGVYSTFFVLLAFLSFLKGYEDKSNTHKVLFGLFLGLALLARYTVLWILPVFLIYFLIRDKNLKFLKDKHLWYSVLVFLLVLTPWLIYGFFSYGNPLGGFIHGARASSYWGGEQVWYFYFNYWFVMYSFVGLLFFLGLIYVFYRKEFKNKGVYLLLTWILLFLVVACLMPHKEKRFLLPIAPAVCLLSCYFVYKLRSYRKVLLVISVTLLLFSLASNFYTNSKIYYNINTRCFNEVVAELDSFGGEFVIVSESTSLFRYYLKQENTYYPEIEEENLKILVESREKPVYFVFTRFNSGFKTEEWKELKIILKENYDLIFSCAEDPEVNFIYSA